MSHPSEGASVEGKPPVWWTRIGVLLAVGLALRIVLLPLKGSSNMSELFVPFLDKAVEHPLGNPWNNFPAHYFPYGSALYLIEFVPRWLAFKVFGASALGIGGFANAVFKLPLLALDLFLLRVLLSMAPLRSRQILAYYWFNPVLIYITYVHVQLDLASTAFCMLALQRLIQRRHVESALVMAVAALCKANVVIIVPLMVIYLWRRNFTESALKLIVSWLAIFGAVSAVGFLPVLFASKFAYVVATSPQALRIFAMQVHLSPDSVLYFGFAAVLFVLARLCAATRISEEGLIFGSATLLGMLVLVTDVAPGWYFWIFPFLALFYANYVSGPRLLYWACCVFYMVHFAIVHPDGWVGLGASQASADFPGLGGLTLTLLQTSLAGLLLSTWILVTRREAPIRGFARPQVIGIAGDSGAGKDTLGAALTDLFGEKHTLVMPGDDYHRWERRNENWKSYTHLNPRANLLGDLAADADDLVLGRLVFNPSYDHHTGMFTAPREMRPNRTIIMQGLHTLYLRGMRDTIDLKIFLSPEPVVRLGWKVQRDVQERGHSVEKVLQSLKAREHDSKAHIQPQRDLADWVVEFYAAEPITEGEVIAGKPVKYAIRHTLWNDAPVAEILDRLQHSGQCRVNIENSLQDTSRIIVETQGGPDPRTLYQIAEASFSSLREITRGRNPPRFQGGDYGVLQLLALGLLSRRERPE